jgi:hypothetical protein
VTTTPRIKLQDVYLGMFDMDNEGETVTPIIVAVATEQLPMLSYVDDSDANHNVPVYEIIELDFLRTKKGILTGKVDVTISSHSQVVEEDTVDIDEVTLMAIESIDNDDYDLDLTEEEFSAIKSELRDQFIEKAIAQESEEETVSNEYIITLDSTFILTMMALHLGGEIYITLFDSENKPARKNTVIDVEDLQVMIQFPTLNSPASDAILQDITDVASARGMVAVHQITPPDAEEAARYTRIRGDMFIMLSELMEGSVSALEDIKALMPAIDDFEQRIVLDGKEYSEGDEDIDVVITMIDSIISKLGFIGMIPRPMQPQEVMNFRSDFKEFSEIISDLNDDDEFSDSVSMLNEELSINDKQSIAAAHNDGTAIVSYVNSPISRGTLPEELFLLGDELDFAYIYDRDWSQIDSMASFMDEEGNQLGTLGECLVGGLIVSVIKAMRFARAQEADNNMLFLSTLLYDVAPPEAHWQLGAFAKTLAEGKTGLFQKMIATSLPSKVALSQAILSSFMGVTLTAFAKSIIEEEWSDEVVEIALAQSPMIIRFLKEVKEIAAANLVNFQEDEDNDYEELTPSELIMLNKQILVHSIQQSIFNLGQQEIKLEEVSQELTSAVLAVADINTGKKTDSAFNSSEWINTKADYISKLFQMDSLKFF